MNPAMQVTATGYPNIFNYQAATRVRSQSTSQTPSVVDGGTSEPLEPVGPRQRDGNLDQKMADMSRIQGAFMAALRIGRDIEKHFEPIL